MIERLGISAFLLIKNAYFRPAEKIINFWTLPIMGNLIFNKIQALV